VRKNRRRSDNEDGRSSYLYGEESDMRTLISIPLLVLVAAVAAGDSGVAPAHRDDGSWKCLDLGGMSCERELEEFLSTAEVVKIEDVGDGITKPRRVTLRKNGVEARAIFKTVDITTTDVAYTNRLESVFTDKFFYEVAAYRIDRLLGIGLVPVTVLRTIDGELGSVQFWIEGAMKMQDAFDRDLPVRDTRLLMQRLMLMYVLDAMIYNIDRNFTNILVRPDRDDFFLIDHSRAFRTTRKLPSLKEERKIPVPEPVARSLRELDLARLSTELDGLLRPKQIRAIDLRRQLLLDELGQLGVLPASGST
jgi:hypothetical protein